MIDSGRRAARLRGRLAVWLLEVRADFYLGVCSARIREMICAQVESLIGDGDALVAWDAPNDAGVIFETYGVNWRVSVDFDGLRPVAVLPQNSG